VIEADRRLPLQHGLRFNLTAKPYLAGHNQNDASQRGVATVATYQRCTASMARALSAAPMKFMHRCHVALSPVAEKQQAWDVREGELNFD
jgi:hypothetical protein